MLEKSEKNIVKHFFLSNVISDEQRKELWIWKIGNKLKINKVIYLNLIERLMHEEFPKKIDKLIKDDLNRTQPVENDIVEGNLVYEQIRTILKLWHLFRPDIGYTQGMAYYVCILYTYYDEYETFKLFCNLLLNRDLVYSQYSFDKVKVSLFSQTSKNIQIKLYTQIFEYALRKYDNELMQHQDKLEIGLETFIMDWLFTLYARSFDIDIVRYFFSLARF